ncbi:MAG: glycosyltransferase [Acidobacteriota bacterium]|nr:MAG: glycosyltransferase [Acidobacteriota bacterium]
MEGVKVTRVPYFYPYFALGEQAKRRLDQKGGNLFSFALMRALSRYPGLQMLHLHTGKRVGGIVRHVARKRGIPYVISLHGGVLDVPEDESATWTSPTQGAWEWGKILGYWVGSRRVLNDAAAVICVGQEEQRRIRERYPAQKVHHLPNGVNARKFSRGEGARFRSRHQLAADERILLTVGRIDPQKNQLFLIRCLPEILKREPRARLILIGHVTNDDYYQSLLTLFYLL